MIKVSNSESGPFHQVLEGYLEDAKFKGCNVPIEKFPLQDLVEARYIEFYILEFYAPSGGLQHFSFVGNYISP